MNTSKNTIDQILDEAGKQMAREIDNEIIWSIQVLDCTSKGWHLANIDRFTDNNHAIDITDWIEENIKGAYHRNGRHFIFENYKDASWFLLRWG